MDFNLPLKKAREQWEKVYLSQQLKTLMTEIFQKPLKPSEWRGQHCTEN